MKQIRYHPTLAAVAEKAGVGKTTVSRVINGALKVSPETLERVNRVIKELGYQPNQAARSLKGDGTKSIGLIIPRVADPFFARCAESAQAMVQSRDYLMMVAATNYDPQAELKQIQTMVRHRVEGILLAPVHSESKALIKAVGDLKIPVITFDHPLSARKVHSVVSDNYGGAREAIEHLLAHGCRRILALGGNSELYTVRRRHAGYLDAIRHAGLEPIIEGSANDGVTVQAVLKERCLVRKSIDGLFCVRNQITAYAFEALQDLGVSIPGHVALIGFDDFELASSLRPAVTVVRQPIEEIGAKAASLLFEHLQNSQPRKNTTKVHMTQLNTTLVLRQSCGCP